MSDAQYAAYTMIATSTLTASLADNLSARHSFNKTNCLIDVAYTPAQNGRICTILVEFATGDFHDFLNTTLVYSPLTVLLATDTTGSRSALEAPITITGATATTKYTRRFDLREIGQNIRLSAKENGAASFGTVQIKATFY